MIIKHLIALAAGLIFGLGLVLAGMSNPLKVQNFLDVFGTWDPSLAFVMAGAILVTAAGFRLSGFMLKPLLAETFAWPEIKSIDGRMIAGAAIFGVGWGMSGVCPGPASTLAHLGTVPVLSLIAAIVLGMILAKLVPSRP